MHSLVEVLNGTLYHTTETTSDGVDFHLFDAEGLSILTRPLIVVQQVINTMETKGSFWLYRKQKYCKLV